ncbi:hypothetical protein EDB89DRAFT_747800 [Lactarius sanguifluus]|nr:hypothetical protein EDB89DRAFT_747800 [Lactarius sanguifluus]
MLSKLTVLACYRILIIAGTYGIWTATALSASDSSIRSKCQGLLRRTPVLYARTRQCDTPSLCLEGERVAACRGWPVGRVMATSGFPEAKRLSAFAVVGW